MGTFSTKASNALEKVLKRKTLVDIRQLITRLGLDLDNCVNETEYIEQEADRVLDVTYDVGGEEIMDKGPLANNLTRNLDGPSLTRAISTATSVLNMISAEREAWLLRKKAEHEGRDRATRWEPGWEKNHGPGV